ncbi:MAG: hypothetical protein JO117_09660 [Verrucomicrobia bacterium]|nr:hypothetical protein [Verrucomicrobiota bacterium]MBV9657097.1 hypothetical protein [Verrucomicrobiota bacterium]
MKGVAHMLRTLSNEAGIALLTGMITFGLCLLLTRGAVTAAAGFGLTAALVAGALDTLYFHLLFLQREGRVLAAEKRYFREIADTKRRLHDGSLRLREALLRRFEEDFRRSRVTHPDSAARRQLPAAKARLKARLWVLRRAVSGEELHSATTAVKIDGEILDDWTERIDGLVDARLEVQRRESVPSAFFNRLRPTRLARQTRQLFDDWEAQDNHQSSSATAYRHPVVAPSLHAGDDEVVDGSGTVRP